MKIGFLMGSFDPIHIGHINMVKESLNFVDKVIVVISGHNPWKKDIEPATFTIRMAMAIKALEPFGERVEISGIESSFEPPYYANKPLNYFKEQYPDDDKYIICGTDTVDKIPYWKDAATDILPFYKIICLERESTLRSGEIVNEFTEDNNGNRYEYTHVFINPISTSSTYIRQLVKDGKEIYPLVPIEVEKIIRERELYTKV